jgi:hypothetical protein
MVLYTRRLKGLHITYPGIGIVKLFWWAVLFTYTKWWPETLIISLQYSVKLFWWVCSSEYHPKETSPFFHRLVA